MRVSGGHRERRSQGMDSEHLSSHPMPEVKMTYLVSPMSKSSVMDVQRWCHGRPPFRSTPSVCVSTQPKVVLRGMVRDRTARLDGGVRLDHHGWDAGPLPKRFPRSV